MSKIVITIEREAGSGGRQIGKLIAEKMGAKCYDEELLEQAAKDSGIAEELFHAHDEKATSSFLYSLVMDTYSFGYNPLDMPINHKVFLAQFESIKKIAQKENCVIIGRCADFALSDLVYTVSVFVSCDPEVRIKRLMEQRGLDAKKAKDLMTRTDKDRASYYNYYADNKWGDAKNYDLCVNTTDLTLEDAADLIYDFAKRKVEVSTLSNNG